MNKRMKEQGGRKLSHKVSDICWLKRIESKGWVFKRDEATKIKQTILNERICRQDVKTRKEWKEVVG